MKSDPFDGAVEVDRIRWYLDRVAQMTDIVEGKHHLDSTEVEQAQYLLKQFKDRLREDLAYVAAYERKHSLDSALHTYQATIHQTLAEFQPAINSNPIKSRWHECLYDARISLEFHYPEARDSK